MKNINYERQIDEAEDNNILKAMKYSYPFFEKNNNKIIKISECLISTSIYYLLIY